MLKLRNDCRFMSNYRQYNGRRALHDYILLPVPVRKLGYNYKLVVTKRKQKEKTISSPFNDYVLNILAIPSKEHCFEECLLLLLACSVLEIVEKKFIVIPLVSPRAFGARGLFL